MTDVEFLSRRLAKMETRFRWMTRGVMIAAFLIIAAALTAQVRQRVLPGDVLPGSDRLTVQWQQPTSRSVEEEVRARHFVLVDEKGKERASLVADNAGSVFLVMFDA